MTRGSTEQLRYYHDTWGTNRDGLFDKGVTKNKVNIMPPRTDTLCNSLCM